MPAKIRLQRHGKKGEAFFHIVVADGRAPRDGKFIEKLGTYNPSTNPATINIDGDKTFNWLKNGAQPTDTCRAILSYKGVLYRYHLSKGVAKGALTQEQADAKLAKWMEEKEAKVASKVSKLSDSARDSYKKRMDAETAAKEAKAAKIAAKNAELVAAATATAETTETATDNTDAAPAAENTEA